MLPLVSNTVSIHTLVVILIYHDNVTSLPELLEYHILQIVQGGKHSWLQK